MVADYWRTGADVLINGEDEEAMTEEVVIDIGFFSGWSHCQYFADHYFHPGTDINFCAEAFSYFFDIDFGGKLDFNKLKRIHY